MSWITFHLNVNGKDGSKVVLISLVDKCSVESAQDTRLTFSLPRVVCTIINLEIAHSRLHQWIQRLGIADRAAGDRRLPRPSSILGFGSAFPGQSVAKPPTPPPPAARPAADSADSAAAVLPPPSGGRSRCDGRQGPEIARPAPCTATGYARKTRGTRALGAATSRRRSQARARLTARSSRRRGSGAYIGQPNGLSALGGESLSAGVRWSGSAALPAGSAPQALSHSAGHCWRDAAPSTQHAAGPSHPGPGSRQPRGSAPRSQQPPRRQPAGMDSAKQRGTTRPAHSARRRWPGRFGPASSASSAVRVRSCVYAAQVQPKVSGAGRLAGCCV